MLCFNKNTFPSSERENALNTGNCIFFTTSVTQLTANIRQWNVGCHFSSSLFIMHALQHNLRTKMYISHADVGVHWLVLHIPYECSTRSSNEDVRARYLWKPFKIFFMTISLFGKGTFKFISKDHVTIRAFFCGHDVTFCNFNKQGSKSLGNFDHMIIWMNTEFYIVSCTRSATERMLSYKTAQQNEAADSLRALVQPIYTK